MKLLYSPGACSLASHIVARETGAQFTLVRADFKAGTLSDGRSFKDVTAKAMVPALEFDDGSVLTEGAAIVQYLADKAPAAKLLPPVGDMARYRVIEAFNFLATELHKGCFTPLFKPDRSPGYKEIALASLQAKLSDLNAVLGKQEYLVGNGFTVADAYLFTQLRWPGFLGIDLAPWSNLVAYMDRIAARPKVAEALAAEAN